MEPVIVNSINELEKFVDSKVDDLLSEINPEQYDAIYVSRKLIDPETNKAIFDHTIHVGPIGEVVNTKIWDDSELFLKKDAMLQSYLKGRLLIQVGTSWKVFSKKMDNLKLSMKCNYLLVQDAS